MVWRCRFPQRKALKLLKSSSIMLQNLCLKFRVKTLSATCSLGRAHPLNNKVYNARSIIYITYFIATCLVILHPDYLYSNASRLYSIRPDLILCIIICLFDCQLVSLWRGVLYKLNPASTVFSNSGATNFIIRGCFH